MLNRVERPIDPTAYGGVEIPKAARSVDFALLLGAARRQASILALGASMGVLLGFAYIFATVPQFTATTDLLIESQKDKDSAGTSIAELTFDTGAIDSQVDVLKSQKIALSVISTLKLANDPAFAESRGTALGQAMTFLRSTIARWFATGAKSNAEESELRRAAIIKQLKDNLDVRRDGGTYVLSINYTSPDRGKAAAVANAFAEAYLADQLDSKFEATQRASGWMQARIAELKKDSLESDSAVQKFKADHGLITADGKLVSDQQLSELNTQMVLAHRDTASAEARYSQIAEILKSGQSDAAVTDSLGSPVITELRQKFLADSKTESELESKLGAAHLQVVALKRNMAEYQRLIFEELKRIADTYRNDGEVARAKEQSLDSSMAALVGQNAGTNQTMVQLRELEREAETYRTLYQSFLQRYQETIQQQSYPMTEARVITAALPPTVPSRPKRSLALAFSLVLGLMAGGAIGVLKEFGDRVFRVASQVRNELGLEPLGMLQVVETTTPYKSIGGERRAPKLVAPKDSLQRYSIDHPLSAFSETLRAIKVAADLSLADRKSKIIGVISVLPREGKSTVSKNFASLLAHLGTKTLLIDGDLRNPGLTRALAAHADAGILEAIRGDRALSDLLLSEPDSGLSFLPAVITKRVHHTSEILASTGMRSLLTESAKDFDYIVVDLPPLAPVVDVRAAASMFDAFVLVVEWGQTSRPMVQTMLGADGLIYDRCIGVVFNKVQLDKIGLYERQDSKDYYYRHFSQYYGKENEPA
jgi:succinoglycan biosynthesis transport protein ExoP